MTPLHTPEQQARIEIDRQLDAAVTHARSRGVAIKGDLPIVVSPTSVETWVRPDLFRLGAQTGAPPDAFAERGQNWLFPTYVWEAMEADGYRWWRTRFEAMARSVDVYRIDHVLGFFRIQRGRGAGGNRTKPAVSGAHRA